MHVANSTALVAIPTATVANVSLGLVAAQGVYVRLLTTYGYVLVTLVAGVAANNPSIGVWQPTDYNAQTWQQLNFPN